MNTNIKEIVDNGNELDKTNNDKKIKNDECQELKNIQFKTMLLNGNNNEITPSTYSNLDVSVINNYLDNKIKKRNDKPWSKLDKTDKIHKLHDYVDNISKEHKLSITEIKDLKKYLICSLEIKKLQKVKDVIYDKTNGKIKNIPRLQFNNINRNFTIKRCDKRISTLKSLGNGRKRIKK